MNKKLKIALNLITFAAVGLVIYFGWDDIVLAWRKIGGMNPWILALMIPLQLVAFFASAKLAHHFFKVVGVNLSTRTLWPVVIEMNFVNHIFPSGGVSGISYFALRLKSDAVSGAKSTLAQLVRFAATFLVFIGLLVVAVFLLSLEDKAGRVIIFISTALTFTLLCSAIGLMYIVGEQSRIDNFTKGLSRSLNKFIHLFRRKHPETIRIARLQRSLRELHEDYVLLRGKRGPLARIILWALVAIVAEIAPLYVAFVAQGEWVNPGAVIIAFGVATTAGMLAILPGGLGLYEPLMAAVLLAAGVEKDAAYSATLVYRVVTLLFALLTGSFLYHRTLRRYGKDRSER